MAALTKVAKLEKLLADANTRIIDFQARLEGIQKYATAERDEKIALAAKADELQRELNRSTDREEIARDSHRRAQNENLLLRGYLERINEDERMAENRSARRGIPSINNVVSTRDLDS